MVLTLIIALFSLILLMVIHEFGHFVIAKKFGARVDEFGIGFPPRLYGKKFGETFYSINLVPLGAFVKIHGEEGGVDDYRSFSNLKIWKRILICLGGVIAFWLAAIIIFSVVFAIGASIPIGDNDVQGVADTKVKILSIQENSPAKAAGLMVGDTLEKINGVNIDKVADFQKFVQENKGRQVALTLNRNGKQIEVSLVPRVSYPEGQGPTGVSLERIADLIERHDWYRSPVEGTIYTLKLTGQALKGIYGFFASLVKGDGVPKGAEVAGPVGITIFLSRAADFGPGFFLYFVGSLSVLLALFNLFPIPALDGGKLLFLVIEKVAKKPVPVKWEQGITIFFFTLLLTLSIFVTIKFDFPRVAEFWKTNL